MRARLKIGGAALVGLTAAGLVGAVVNQAHAAGVITFSGGGNVTTLDWGKYIAGGALTATYAETTHAFRADAGYVGNLHLILDSYQAPAGESLTGALYRAPRSAGTAAPTAGWVLVDPALAGAANLTATDTQFVAATHPGTYRFHWESDGTDQGVDDNQKSAPITMTVLDLPGASGVTDKYLADDWAPAITATPTAVVGDSTTAKVTTGLTGVDARGSNVGVGVLAANTANLLRFVMTGTDDPGKPGPDLMGDIAIGNASAQVLPDGTACRDAWFPVVGWKCPDAVHLAVREGVTSWTGKITYQVAVDGTLVSTSAQTNVVKAMVGQIGLDVTPNTGTAPLTVTLVGTTPDKGKIVTINTNESGVSRTVASDPITGAFTYAWPVPLTKTTVFSASSASAVSPDVTVTVTPVQPPAPVADVKVTYLKVTSSSSRTVTITAKGAPKGKGGLFTITVDGTEVKTKASSNGSLSITLTKQKAGKHTYGVTYTDPEGNESDEATKTVNVKK